MNPEFLGINGKNSPPSGARGAARWAVVNCLAAIFVYQHHERPQRMSGVQQANF
jgi:hypothetical protein